MIFLVDPEFGNRNGDNLTYCEDDEYDENACFNWVNHPVRQLYDNPKTRFHPSNLYEDEDNPAEDPLWRPTARSVAGSRRIALHCGQAPQ